MYGKWLYKEVKTPYGYAKIEIYQKGYAGEAQEIESLAAESVVLSVSNLSEVISPLQKSQLSFSIIDTAQFDYSAFFTPDARKYKVELYTMLEGGEYVKRWSGFLTPDSYAEDLQYRSNIDLIARDNIGILNDYQFDYVPTDVNSNVDSIRNIILAGFKKISDPYPMDVVFRTGKTSIESEEQASILVIDSVVNCYQMYGKSWGEVLETLLHDMGLQLRYIDYNTLAIYDLSQLYDYAGDSTSKEFQFLGASGVREVQPAWREYYLTQDYGIIDDFYVGDINSEAKLNYVRASSFNNNISLYEPVPSTHWSKQGDVYLLNFFNVLNSYVDDNKSESIYITGCSSETADSVVAENKLIYSQRINAMKKQITISFDLCDTLREPNSTLYSRGEAGASIFYLPYQQVNRVQTPMVYQLKYRFNVYLVGDNGKTYIMREKWVELPAELDEPFIEFTTERLKTYYTNVITQGGSNSQKFTQYNNSKDFSIIINDIPVDGVLQFVVYPYTFADDSYAGIRDTSAFERGAKIANLAFKVETESKGLESQLVINAEHNIKADDSFTYGQVPQRQGDFLLYTGGLFYPDSLVAINGFKLPNHTDVNYHLLELVGRERAHYNKDNYNALSGDFNSPINEPMTFRSHFIREGKKYILLDSSLNIIRNTISATRMTEIVPYEDASYTQINSPISTGKSSVTGGRNTILQFSEKAGNAKRIYELDTATEQDYEGSYIVIDKPEMNEAKKLSVENIVGQSQWFEERTTPSGKKYLHTNFTIATVGDVVTGAEGDVDVPEGEGGGLKFAEERTFIPSKMIFKMFGMTVEEEEIELTDEERQYNIETFNLTESSETPIVLSVGGMWLYYYSSSYVNDVVQHVRYCAVISIPEGGLETITVDIYPNGDVIVITDYQPIGLTFSKERVVVPTRVDYLGNIQDYEIGDIERAYNIETLNLAFKQVWPVLINLNGAFLSYDGKITDNGVRKAYFCGMQVTSSGFRKLISVELIENGDAILKMEYDPYAVSLEELNSKLNDIIERLNKAGI